MNIREEVEQLNQDMQQALKDENWDTLSALAKTRHELLVEGFHNKDESLMDKAFIDKIIASDKIINALVMDQKTKLVKDFQQVKQNNKANKAYQTVMNH